MRGEKIPPGIAAELAAQGGRVTFARFMELALTHPTEGYYCRSQGIIGPRGHFSTAPRLSRAFNEAVGRLLEELVGAFLDATAVTAAAPRGVVLLELGAGEGDLAVALLQEWQATRPDLRDGLTYGIVEVGEHLRARQRHVLTKLIDSGWRVRWAGTVEEALAGAAAVVVVGNEFVDALPVHLVDVRGAETLEAWVEIGPSGKVATADAAGREGAGGERARGHATLREVWAALSGEAEAELRGLFGTTDGEVLRPFTRDGIIELRPGMGTVLRQMAACLSSVGLLTIDYGEWFEGPGQALDCPGTEWGGTRRCAATRLRPYGRTTRGYFRHQLETDLYERVGRQDLTADVDFRALDFHGRQAGFETVLFTTVAGLLRANGGEERLETLCREALRASSATLDADRQAMVLEALLDDQGLGGVFKVMLQVRE